jgi:catechol-2,3-dioxygenase
MEIKELQLAGSDLPALQEFYSIRLGFAVEKSSAGTLSLRAGGSRLIFRETADRPTGVYHFAFNIPPNVFEAATVWAAQHTDLIRDRNGEDRFQFEHWRAESLYFFDAEGNIVELIARRDLAATSPSRESKFGAESILSISEIGLASSDVPATVRMLLENLPVQIYDGPGSETFTAVGDPHGLLIVVKEGRIWFPDTGKAARPLPMRLIVPSGSGNGYVLSGPPYSVERIHGEAAWY